MRLVLSSLALVAEAAVPLPALSIEPHGVVSVGLGHSADFAHQLHVAFSSVVTGSCIFANQPFHCAVEKFGQDPLWGLVASKEHCKRAPHVVDVGSLVDYPRRQCGQNPISIQECIDDVEFLRHARIFAFQGIHDDVYLPGSVENTVALLAQMQTDPAKTIKLVNDQPFGHVLPLNSTRHVGSDEAAGYDGPGECLRHVFDTPLVAGKSKHSSWRIFDQTPFVEGGVGFQDLGWIYVPEACETQTCKLIVRPDTCTPPTDSAPDAAAFADYAEANDMVVLHPCVGGHVDRVKYPFAVDVASGKFDIKGELSDDYVEQSGPHMRGIGKMLRHLLGVTAESSSLHVASSVDNVNVEGAQEGFAGWHLLPWEKLPTLNIDRTSVMTAGCSNTADFSHQFHVAFSSLVTGSCIFSGQPFHCAVTRFPNDYMVAKTRATAAGIHCPDCPANGTLIYDHCKNHPEWVDINTLAEYAESADGVDDPIKHLAGARVFAFGPTHDRCYRPPAMANVANFHLRYAKNSSQIKLVDDQPFPHTLPKNSTPYFNHSEPAGYDGPGECLRHVFGHAKALAPALPSLDVNYWRRIDTMEFVRATVPFFGSGVGMWQSAWLFVPPQCKEGICKLTILPGGCDVRMTTPPGPGSDEDAFARYAFVNDIVILKPCQGNIFIDKKRFPDNQENLRGMVDVYGQLTEDYATQNGGQMAPIGDMVKRLLGAEVLGAEVLV